MSFHRYLVPPPLIIGVHPAPPPNPKEDKKDSKASEKDGKDKEGDKAKDDKAKDDDKKQDNNKDKDKAVDPKDDQDKAEVKGDVPPENKDPSTPGPQSPGSMINEPPTPAPGAPAPDLKSPAPRPKQDAPQSPVLDKKKNSADKSTSKAESESESKVKDDTKSEDTSKEAEKPAPPLEPLRLLSPAPHRPLRTRLDLDPAKPYPPINTDPRGAYHKYAKGLQNEVIYVDIFKDGWLVDEFRGKSERDALAALRGDPDINKLREIEDQKLRSVKRKVPKSSEDILRDLWNDVVRTNCRELHADEFWSRYDWSDLEAQVHLLDIKRELKEEEKEKPRSKPEEREKKDRSKEVGDEDNGKKDGAPGDKKATSATGDIGETVVEEKKSEIVLGERDGEGAESKVAIEATAPSHPEVEWTRSGLEEILATVGIQGTYNTEKPLPRNWAEPAGCYLIMGHGFFLIRTEQLLQWKPETSAGKFEILVSDSQDRIFGQMIQQQRAEERRKKELEYRKKRAAEKAAAAEKEKAEEGKEKKSAKGGDDKDKKSKRDAEGKDDKIDGKEAAEKTRAKLVEDDIPESPGSNVKVKEGEEIKADETTPNENQREIIAVPVAFDNAKGNKDAQHDDPAVAVAVKLVKSDEKGSKDEGYKAEGGEDKQETEKGGEKVKEKEGEKGDKKEEAKKDEDKKEAKKPFDPMREAEKLARMMAGDGQINMEDIKVAFKALEKAAGASLSGEGEKKDKGPLIWTWHESCETWRWKNYEAGLHEVGAGGWEERDWKVFADDRGCEDFDEEEAWVETLEIDLHDWNC